MNKLNTRNILNWALRLIPAIIMLQTLYFKFTGAEESVYIFTRIGMEPWGRYVVGTTELLAGILLLTRWYGLGAIVGLGTITGAIFFHLTVLGIEVQGDGGYLFILALTVFMACTLLILLHFKEVKNQLLSAIKK
ncbi:DoxX family protein [Roseivirga thermotolerans]|uniref:DoxX family protein n=1 Tax=Roseivirga thermotolerans TaxID=1758176 RepID=UPI00273D9F1F|nr:DoxX family protein [Roseivirga thermotolerans]